MITTTCPLATVSETPCGKACAVFARDVCLNSARLAGYSRECCASRREFDRRRLLMLQRAGTEEYGVAVTDCYVDIKRLATVPLEAQAKCSEGFRDKAAVRMRVCGCCGLRDPCDDCHKEVDVCDVSANHWLCVGEVARLRLMRMPWFQLLVRDQHGESREVMAHPSMLYNMVEIDGKWYHILQQALLPDSSSTIAICRGCSRKFSNTIEAKRPGGEMSRATISTTNVVLRAWDRSCSGASN